MGAYIKNKKIFSSRHLIARARTLHQRANDRQFRVSDLFYISHCARGREGDHRGPARLWATSRVWNTRGFGVTRTHKIPASTLRRLRGPAWINLRFAHFGWETHEGSGSHGYTGFLFSRFFTHAVALDSRGFHGFISRATERLHTWSISAPGHEALWRTFNCRTFRDSTVRIGGWNIRARVSIPRLCRCLTRTLSLSSRSFFFSLSSLGNLAAVRSRCYPASSIAFSYHW